jgi:hypothetical protein
MAIDSLLEVRDTINWVDQTSDRDFVSQPSSLILKSKKIKKCQVPYKAICLLVNISST